MPSFKNDREHSDTTFGAQWGSRFCRALLSTLSPGGAHSRLSILIYHRVLSHRDPLFPDEVDAHAFDQQMGILKTCFNVIPLADAVLRLQKGTLPPRTACVTFDDGYADNAEVALPILLKHAIPATFFIATGFLDGGRMWNDSVIESVRRAPGQTLDLSSFDLGTYEIATAREKQQAILSLLGKLKYLPFEQRQVQIDRISKRMNVALPDDLMMTSGQVKKLHRAGMEIGGHTVNHPILSRLGQTEAKVEIAAGKEILENIINAPVRFFAYPNGKPNQDYLSGHVDIVKKLGFAAALSTAWGAAQEGHDLYQLPRFTPWDQGRMRFTMRMAHNMLRSVQQAAPRNQ